MKRLIDKLKSKKHISDERIMKLLSSKVLKDITSVLIEKLFDECAKEQDLPDDMSYLIGKYLKKLNQWIDYWNIDESIWRWYVRETFKSMKDSITLYQMVHDISRTVSATLMLRYSNLSYSLAFDLPLSILIEDEYGKNEIIQNFIHNKEELKMKVQSLNDLEDKEMQELNKWDPYLERLLKNDGELYENLSE